MAQFLRVHEVAVRLQVTEQSVWRWIKSGDLPAVKLGGKAGYRIDPADLEQFIEKRKAA